MSEYIDFFKGKRVTVMGLGLLGRGVGDAAFIAHCGAQVTVTDMKTEAQLADSIAQLKLYSNITFHVGGHVESDFTDTDMIIKAAGVRLDSPYIALARKVGVPVYMSTALFAKFACEVGATIVGITGTRGKSTTTQMIYETLKKYGNQVPVLLGGNVRGVSTLAQLPEVTRDTIAILELDSWQLQGFGDLGISPHIAVFTNLLPDHQNYYAGMGEYFADKAKIFTHQKAGDTLIIGAQVRDRVEAARPPVAPLVPPPLPPDWHLLIPGEHNRDNAALARRALQALGISDDFIKTSLESFSGVEGRLQFVREVNGIKIYNDNNATTPDATIAALKALNVEFYKSRIMLIAGGADKGLDMSGLLYEIAKTCKRVILLAGTGTTRIAPLMQDYSIFDSLDAAVREAHASARPGDVILFSPAFASFGMFKNEYDRGDQFMNIVALL